MVRHEQLEANRSRTCDPGGSAFKSPGDVKVSIDRGSETEATHRLHTAESHTGHQGDTQRPVQRRIREYIARFRPTTLSSYSTRHPATSRPPRANLRPKQCRNARTNRPCDSQTPTSEPETGTSPKRTNRPTLRLPDLPRANLDPSIVDSAPL